MNTIFSLKHFSFILTFFAVITLNWSCKENTILPSDLVPVVDNVHTFEVDTFAMITHTLFQDSLLTGGLKNGVRISNSTTFFHALGTISNDPSFGKTYASMHVEVVPPIASFKFKGVDTAVTRTIDSVVLSIPYKGAYGDTSAGSIQQFKVYRSNGQFSRDSAQYEFTKDTIDYSNVLSTLNVDFSKVATDSPSVGGVKLIPQLRFKINSTFVDSLNAQIALGANGACSDFVKYLSWWKGFSIVGDSTVGNTLGFFDTYHTRLTFYYRNVTNTTGKIDTLSDVFSFDPSYCNRFNTIKHNYFGKVANNFINTNSVQGDSVLFLQSQPGLVNTVNFPSLFHLVDNGNVIVNKAEITFTAVSPYTTWSDTSTYGLIPRLQIFKTDSISENDALIEDYTSFSSTYVDGNRKNITINGVTYIQYVFTVTETLQRALATKNTNYRLKILGGSIGFPGSYRSILQGSGSLNSMLTPKLKIIYTKL